jgi:DNA-binding PadR family transcriptional regulator
MIDLTRREELILLSVWKLRGEAYIVTIRKNLKAVTGRSVNYGSICNTLASLVRKGLIQSRESAPRAQQGGRRKVLYDLTGNGKQALKQAYEVQKLAWDGMNGFVFEAD